MTLLAPGKKTIVGVLHLGPLLGQPGWDGLERLTVRALDDARALEANGVDALLVENFADASPGPFVGPEAVACLAHVCERVARHVALPVGVNVLPVDYRAAFALARTCGLRFVQLDVLVDAVRTDYVYSTAAPFDVRVDLDDLKAARSRLGAEAVALWGTVHPKHYTLLAPARTLEESVAAAARAGAQAVVVTGTATGSAPDPERVARARRAAGGLPVVVGSGLDAGNARALLAHADGGIVGTAFRAPDLGPVVPEKVRDVIAAVRSMR